MRRIALFAAAALMLLGYKRMQEDLEYFRRHAMPDPNRSRDTKPDGDDEPQPATPAE